MSEPSAGRRQPPRATYRLQLRKSFGFAEAGALAPYLAALGISHVYLSPVFKARPGSPHGYDITDHNELSPDLGTEADYRAMITAFQTHGVGRILDIVPNHMGVGGADNPLWLDVLEWGRESPYADWFDIDWEADGGDMDGRLLAPVLGETYGEALKDGKLRLIFEDGAFSVWAHGEHKLPVSPPTYPTILADVSPRLDRIAREFGELGECGRPRPERAATLKTRLAALARECVEAREAIAVRIDRFNGAGAALDRLIAQQRWRVAFARVAEDAINYRRFFNVDMLAGLREEREPVFAHAHKRILAMLRDGDLDGLRVDHVDGLFDPKAYLNALRERAGAPFFLVVEKILAPHERLRRDWPIDGSTGYDYLNESLALLVEPSSKARFVQLWRDFGGSDASFEQTARDAKLRILDFEMASELNVLTRAAARLARTSPMTADLTQGVLRRAMRRVLASFTVYRTYVDGSGALIDEDRHEIACAITQARCGDPDLHPSVLDVLEAVLVGDEERLTALGLDVAAALRLAMKCQQLSGPVMAKGVEDTALYRDNRFIALNEVGGAPDRFGLTAAAFHEANARRARDWPGTMLASATHDTKRGEDTRARLAVVSELPDEWGAHVARWSAILRARSADAERLAPPAREDEYLFYQMLVGSWPADMPETPDAEALGAYAERLSAALRKALREGKLRSRWSAPDLAYEEAALAFAVGALKNDAFLAAFLPFVRRLARLGVENSLAQTVLKLTTPGAPDLFQGRELWDFSFVDPDNRRPVDYLVRERALAEAGATTLPELMRTWTDGHVKLATIATLLAFRCEHALLFSQGDYTPIAIGGEDADCAFGFVRGIGDERLAVLVALRPAKREARPAWDAAAALPEGLWRPLFPGAGDPGRPLRETFAALPFTAVYSGDRLGNREIR